MFFYIYLLKTNLKHKTMTIKDTITGAGGITAVELVPDAVNKMDFTNPNVIQIVIQIVIGLVTLLGLLRPKKNINN